LIERVSIEVFFACALPGDTTGIFVVIGRCYSVTSDRNMDMTKIRCIKRIGVMYDGLVFGIKINGISNLRAIQPQNPKYHHDWFTAKMIFAVSRMKINLIDPFRADR
jgi:hypothetical protein